MHIRNADPRGRNRLRGGVLLLLFAVLTLAAAAGCGKQPATETEATPPQEPVPMRLAYGKKIHYAPQIIALCAWPMARRSTMRPRSSP